MLETFAVWCPTCKKQQLEIKKLHEDVGDAVVSISLNVDPNEDAKTVMEFADSNSFSIHPLS